MKSFDDYWKKEIPNIKSTAGYPLDGKRFISDLEKNNINFDKKILIRSR